MIDPRANPPTGRKIRTAIDSPAPFDSTVEKITEVKLLFLFPHGFMIMIMIRERYQDLKRNCDIHWIGGNSVKSLGQSINRSSKE